MTSVSVETVRYRLSEYASGLPGTELSRYMDKLKLLGMKMLCDDLSLEV